MHIHWLAFVQMFVFLDVQMSARCGVGLRIYCKQKMECWLLLNIHLKLCQTISEHLEQAEYILDFDVFSAWLSQMKVECN